MRVVDLTHPIRSGMPVFPGDEPVIVRRTQTVDRDGFAQTRLAMSTHSGTHLDLPAHLRDGTPTLDMVRPDCFVGQGIVIDLAGVTGIITPAHIAPMLPSDRVDFILLHTGWDRHWNTARYYADFPTLSTESATLLGQYATKGVGLDTSSPDPVESHGLPAHQALFDNCLIIVENLCNLSSLLENTFIFSCLPLPIEQGEGCPVRAVGMVAEE